jgi:hypothetical protein
MSCEGLCEEFVMALADTFEKDGISIFRALLANDADTARVVFATVLDERELERALDEPTDDALEEVACRLVADMRRGTTAERNDCRDVQQTAERIAELG